MDLLDTPSETEISNSDIQTIPAEAVPAISKYKTPEYLEAEDVLRRLQTLNNGDCIYFKKSTLGNKVSSMDNPLPIDFIEGRVVCFTFDEVKQYVVVNLHPHGALQFCYGDLYRMAMARDIYIHRLDMKRIDLSKGSKGGLAGNLNIASKNRTIKSLDDSLPYYAASHSDIDSSCSDLDAYTRQKLLSTDPKARPIPPGVETFCKCRFINKIEFVRKIRGLVRTNRQKFMENTTFMQELRLVLTQNVRAYELEMAAYLLNTNPWQYCSNPHEEPSPERIKEIIEMYKAAVRNPIYMELFAKWQANTSTSIN
ncbi:hypothetical protein BdWA1_003245 [Babesia duncani]|uniref:Uncharacterized protein n=1 Tax=Babesia duncani TaxID=323732 RepID=A0AAD9PJK7_9APIC|nr:hypothetical protein BdWA1_003245 [Babesia duncani]